MSFTILVVILTFKSKSHIFSSYDFAGHHSQTQHFAGLWMEDNGAERLVWLRLEFDISKMNIDIFQKLFTAGCCRIFIHCESVSREWKMWGSVLINEIVARAVKYWWEWMRGLLNTASLESRSQRGSERRSGQGRCMWGSSTLRPRGNDVDVKWDSLC